jgi:hypothetical protein
MFTLSLLAVALAAPVPKAKAAELYFPTVEGTKWVQRNSRGKEVIDETYTVTKVEEKDGVYLVTTTRDTQTHTREVSDKGVVVMLDTVAEKGVRVQVLKLPVKEGDTWTFDLKETGGGIAWTTTYTVGKAEEVTVAAGKYTALPVLAETAVNGRVQTKVTTWFAEGVGEVKKTSVGSNGEWVTELKEFTPGKAK